MLISEPSIFTNDPILTMLAELMGNTTPTLEIQKGVYEITHFGASSFLRNYDHYPNTSVGSYGVCDNIDQLIEQCPELSDPNRQFVVTLTPVVKANQSEEGGWRWHKWGDYIGTQKPTCEYLYDEPEIDKVYCFHIYEKK